LTNSGDLNHILPPALGSKKVSNEVATEVATMSPITFRKAGGTETRKQSRGDAGALLTNAFVSSLSELPPPLLTAYLDTRAAQPSTHGPVPGFLFWLEQEAKRLVERIRPSEQDVFRQQIARADEFLRHRASAERGLVILAGPTTWEFIPLQIQIENELHWGTPALTQLLWLLNENKPYGVVVLNHMGARFLRYRLGEMTELAEQKFDIDISQWKKKELGHVVGQGVEKTRGSQRDTHQHRMDAQYNRLWRDVATHARRLCEAEQLRALFLVGSDRIVEPVQAELPKEFRQCVISIDEDLGWFPLPELQSRLAPNIEEWQQKHEFEIVSALLGDERKAVMGIDEALAQLQKGKIRTVVVARHLNENLRQCIDCGWADRSSDPRCPVCGRERRSIELRNLLPELAASTNADIEVVGGGAAEQLIQSGGMGGWLRGRTQGELR
jgi:Bacterial archaeo-eukaryotic release factor family 10